MALVVVRGTGHRYVVISGMAYRAKREFSTGALWRSIGVLKGCYCRYNILQVLLITWKKKDIYLPWVTVLHRIMRGFTVQAYNP